MKRQFKIALIFGLILSFGLVMFKCKKQEMYSKGYEFAGEYILVSVNGKSVPTSISHEGATLQVLSGAFSINEDGTCKSKTVFVPPSGIEVTREVNATYTKNGSRLTMQWEGAGKTVGIIQDSSFVMDNEGMELEYKRNK
jgi:hypothetical protein